MPVAPMTKLEAVNQMLSGIGESPVNSLFQGTSADARIAVQILDEVDRATQLMGWHFNTEKDFPLSRDINNNINLSANVVRVDVDNQFYPGVDVVQRGTKLYDKKNHTFEFTQDLKGEIIVLLSFEELPEPARYYITTRASRIFQDRVVGSGDAARSLLNDEIQALTLLKEFDHDTGDHSVFDNYDVARIIFR
jgi:hypothetical protein